MIIYQDPQDDTLVFDPSEFHAPVVETSHPSVAHPVWITFAGEWIEDNGEW